MKKAVILDRDGTFIVDKVYLNDPNQIEYLPDVFEAFKILRDHGFIFLVVTNQSGVARGLVDINILHQIHEKIKNDFAKQEIDILKFYYSPHAADSNHHTRKPNPGMLEEAIKDFNLNVKQSWMVGDRSIDIEAGVRAGVNTALVKWPQSNLAEQHPKTIIVSSSLKSIASKIVMYPSEA